MNSMKQALVIFGLIFVFPMISVAAELVTQDIVYESQGVPLQGYLAYDASNKSKRPAVLVVHEWWGHNAYARKRAEMLAQLGYVAFALDMYGNGKVTDHPDDAKKFMQQAISDQESLQKRFKAALDLVKQNEFVDSDNIAAIGYCFGGGVVLNMARSGADLKSVVSFHGSLATKTPVQQGQVKAKVVVFHGGNDAFIPAEQVEAFEQEMTAANVDYDLIVYDGADHSFTNPAADQIGERHSMPVGYDEEADLDSWQKMQGYFAQIFMQESDTTELIEYSDGY